MCTRVPSRPRPSFAPALLLLASACASTSGGASKTASTASAAPAAGAVAPGATPASLSDLEQGAAIGFFLAKVDERLRGWSNLKLGSRSDEDQRKLRVLEQTLERDTRERRADLIEQLQSGPPKNRAIAAVALGFTGAPEAQAAMLAALSDSDPGVVCNAAQGLGLLGFADTPTSQLAFLLRDDPDAWTRNNAAYALLRIATANEHPAFPAETLAALRGALSDDMEGVRAQAAACLGQLTDVDALKALEDALYDPTQLVSRAAAVALSHIGLAQPASKGGAARALVTALAKSRADRRARLRLELMRLAGTDFGDEVDDWREWAFKLP